MTEPLSLPTSKLPLSTDDAQAKSVEPACGDGKTPLTITIEDSRGKARYYEIQNSEIVLRGSQQPLEAIPVVPSFQTATAVLPRGTTRVLITRLFADERNDQIETQSATINSGSPFVFSFSGLTVGDSVVFYLCPGNTDTVCVGGAGNCYLTSIKFMVVSLAQE